MPAPVQYVVTPWRNASELLQVRKDLYTPSSPSDQATAISKVFAWKLRGNLPHAVESTALLFSALSLLPTPPQSDAEAFSSNEPAKTGCLASDLRIQHDLHHARASLSIALNRFVTGYADLGRRTGPGQTMGDVAKTIGLPAHFVELRHEAAHGEMPSLRRSIEAAEEATQWLWNDYWARVDVDEQAGQFFTSTTSIDAEDARAAERKGELKKLLKGFRFRQVASFQRKSDPGYTVEEDVINTCHAVIEVCGESEKRMEELASLMVGGGLILPNDPNYDTARWMAWTFKMWNDLLLALSEASTLFGTALVTQLVAALPQRSGDWAAEKIHEPAVKHWLAHIVKWDDWAVVHDFAMQTFCLNPGYWTLQLGKTILEYADEKRRAYWQPIFDAAMEAERPDAESPVAT